MNEGLSCSLSPEKQKQRREALEDVLLTDDVTVSAGDGDLTLEYPGDTRIEEDLVDFVRRERECCPFFDFELAWEHHHGPVSLTLRHEAISEEDWASLDYLPV